MEAEDLVEQLDRFGVDAGTVLGAAKIMLDRLEPEEAMGAMIGWMQSFGLSSFIPSSTATVWPSPIRPSPISYGTNG